MIVGAHALLYSRRPEETRELLARLLGGRRVDAGGGWLILALPPAEIAVHPTGGAPFHEIYLMCDNLEATLAGLAKRGVKLAGPVEEAGWGLLTHIALPGGGKLGLYEPHHPTAIPRRPRPAKGKRRPAKARRTGARRSGS
jgi:hypothetical protein